MTNLQLYLNDELVDLSDDSPIAFTYQINNLAEVQNQQGNTSNQFKVPLTHRNRRILGYPDEVAFTTDLPYKQYQAKIVQDGMEIIPYGVGELNSIDQDTASITVLSGNVDFFDAIDGQLYDMGDTNSQWHSTLWGAYNHQWTLNNVVASQTKTEGWIWPVVDYGNLAASTASPPVIDVTQMRPGFFLKSAIELLVASAGYKIDPDSFLVNEPLYKNLIVQFANDSFEHSTDVQNGNDGLSVTVQTGAQETINKSSILSNETGIVPFTKIVSNPAGLFKNNGYTPGQRVTATVTLTFSMRLIGNIGKGTIRIGIRLANVTDNDPTSTLYTLNDNPTRLTAFNYGYKDYLNQKMSCDIDLPANGSVVVFFDIQDKNTTQCIISAGATLDIKSKNQQVLYGQTVQCERIFPDISQKDLLKDTLQRFSIICQTDNTKRTVRLASFREIVNNIPRAKDWSGKCLNQGKSIAFRLGDYAQVNYMRYKADDNVLPANLGQSQIKVADTTLPASADLFESQFAATMDVPYLGGSIAQIKKMEDDSTDFTISTEPRILINNQVHLNELKKSVVFTDGSKNVTVNSTISVPYFKKPADEPSLLYDWLRQAYYPELEKILTQSKKVVRYLLLTPRDILELDLLIPVYLQQDGAYYYINKIDSWRKGQPTKVELVKLG